MKIANRVPRWARSTVVKLALAAGLFYPAAASEATLTGLDQDVVIDRGTGPRHVSHWRQDPTKSWKGMKKFWMVTHPSTTGVPTAQMAQDAGISIGAGWRQNENVIYPVQVKGDPDAVYKALQAFPEFIGLEPFREEDKIAPDLYARRALNMEKKWKRSATRESDPMQEIVGREVKFSEKKTCSKSREWCAKHNISSLRFVGQDSNLVIFVPINQIEMLLKDGDIEDVSLFSEGKPTSDQVRKLSNIGALQFGILDTLTTGVSCASQTYPCETWNKDLSYTGEGVYVGIWDNESFCANNKDFLESGVFRGVPGYPNAYTVDCQSPTEYHATRTAGAAVGNGVLSSIKFFNGVSGRKYQWRGVAPKARIYAANLGTYPGTRMDVNNHSHITSKLGYYVSNDAQVDGALADHNPDGGEDANNISVYAVANNGWYQGDKDGYGSQIGHFSMLVNSKNAIKVGAVGKFSGERSFFSGMGPTRDGRIGPDVMAPGSSDPIPVKIEIDAISIQNAGTQVRGASADLNWTFDGVLGAANNSAVYQWFAAERVRNLTANNPAGVLSAEMATSGQIGVAFGEDIPKSITNEVVIRLKITPVNVSETWGVGDVAMKLNTSPAPGELYETPIYMIPLNGSWVEKRISVGSAFKSASAWKNLNIQFEPRTTGVISSEGSGGYAESDGTSIAAPHVTGVVALMLQKYAKNYLSAAKTIHHDPIWNSTAKAILIHSSTDMILTQKNSKECDNPDFAGGALRCGNDPLTTVYTKGPDWATGYGLVNAKKALDFVNTDLFKESNLKAGLVAGYRFQVPSGQPTLRMTLAWDDPAAQAQSGAGGFDRVLQNDLDIVAVSPSGSVKLPWVIDATPLVNSPTGKIRDGILPPDGLDVNCTRTAVLNNPAYKGTDSLNNVEVIDVDNPEAGEWSVMVRAKSLLQNQNPQVSTSVNNQDYSLVADYKLNPLGLTIWDPSGKPAELATDGTLRLKGCTGTTLVAGGMQFNVSSVAKASLDRTNGLRASSVSGNQSSWLNVATNLSGSLVFSDPSGTKMAAFTQSQGVKVRGNYTCSSY